MKPMKSPTPQQWERLAEEIRADMKSVGKSMKVSVDQAAKSLNAMNKVFDAIEKTHPLLKKYREEMELRCLPWYKKLWLKIKNSKPTVDEIKKPSFWDVQDFVGKVLYMEGEHIGIVVNFDTHINGSGVVNLTVDPSVTEFRAVMNSKTCKTSKYQIYETVEFENWWMVDEIQSVGCRRFRIQVQKKL